MNNKNSYFYFETIFEGVFLNKEQIAGVLFRVDGSFRIITLPRDLRKCLEELREIIDGAIEIVRFRKAQKGMYTLAIHKNGANLLDPNPWSKVVGSDSGYDKFFGDIVLFEEDINNL